MKYNRSIWCVPEIWLANSNDLFSLWSENLVDLYRSTICVLHIFFIFRFRLFCLVLQSCYLTCIFLKRIRRSPWHWNLSLYALSRSNYKVILKASLPFSGSVRNVSLLPALEYKHHPCSRSMRELNQPPALECKYQHCSGSVRDFR